MKILLIVTAFVLSPVILLFMVFVSAVMMAGRNEQYQRVYHAELLIKSPDGLHVAVIKEGHYEPYFISPPRFTEVWISHNQAIAAPAVKVYDGRSYASWTDDSHLTVILNGLPEDGVSLHEAEGVKVSYHLSGPVYDKYFAPSTNNGVEENRTTSHVALPSYDEFRKWARENADNAE